MKVAFGVQTPASSTIRARQLESMFDVPRCDVSRREWSIDAGIEARDWRIGLILGPSGSGKTQIAKRLFPDQMQEEFQWSGAGVIDDIAPGLSLEAVASTCSAVGFNTIPAWLRPYSVLSNGEQFRASIARRLLSEHDTIVVDEFTSVVDRQTAKVVAAAVAKYMRRAACKRRFVACSCHYDIVDWLQPDWIIEPAANSFAWRELRRRPSLECSMSRVSYSAWRRFAPYHYLTAELHTSAQCFGLFVGDECAAFAGVLFRPFNGKGKPIMGISRVVTLPDWQGLGLAFALMDTIGACYKSIGRRLHMYPAHPSFIRSFDRSVKWALKKKPNFKSSLSTGNLRGLPGKQGSRPCAVFSYEGPAHEDHDEARSFIAGYAKV